MGPCICYVIIKVAKSADFLSLSASSGPICLYEKKKKSDIHCVYIKCSGYFDIVS